MSLQPISISSLPAHMPDMLTWPEKPAAVAGDIYVFEWGHFHYRDPETGYRKTSKFPAKYIELLAHPARHRKGHWQAPFIMVGWDKTRFMAPAAGTTTNPLRAIDDAPLEEVKKSRDQLLDEARTRSTKRQDSRRNPNRDSRSTVPSAGPRTIPN